MADALPRPSCGPGATGPLSGTPASNRTPVLRLGGHNRPLLAEVGIGECVTRNGSPPAQTTKASTLAGYAKQREATRCAAAKP